MCKPISFESEASKMEEIENKMGTGIIGGVLKIKMGTGIIGGVRPQCWKRWEGNVFENR